MKQKIITVSICCFKLSKTPGFTHIYVRSNGTYRNEEGRELHGNINYQGYSSMCIGNKNLYAHRLVADAFVTNPKPWVYDIVDHIQGVTAGNQSSNLRWTDHSGTQSLPNTTKAVQFALQCHALNHYPLKKV